MLGLGDYSSAYIDNGVALFILAACAALWRWREAPDALVLAAFFLGLAAGAKYQALMALPPLGVFVLWRERRARVLATALLCFLLPCGYWYARNALLTGDPFNPVGGRVFGFTNWNLDDYRVQFQDLRGRAGWPPPMLWPVLAAPFGKRWQHSAALRAATVFCACSLLIWAVTSRYPRYLSFAYPLLALTAAAGWLTLFDGVAAAWRKTFPQRGRGIALDRARRWLVAAPMIAAAVVAFGMTARRAQMIAVTPAQRDAVLRQRVPGYAVMNELREHATGRVYQIGLESAIYYGPRPVWGDVFGPWRYADFIRLAPAELARKLWAEGFEILAVSLPTARDLEARPGFADHFIPMYAEDGAKAYRIRPSEHRTGPP
jgi:hypothetical protein